MVIGAVPRELGSRDMALRTPVVPERQGPDLDLLLRQQEDRARKRFETFQPAVEVRSAGHSLAIGSYDTGGSPHERRGRQY